ncbi:MFS transporter [Streptomonospora sp. PA3]|uniref:MFS transporter n=1 Tax=Streptomonospora sp. PA3 TaxID=2607326 RepID=UPI0031BA5F33
MTTSYGVLYYAFPVLAPAISADTGWSLWAVTAAFSAAQVVTAVAGAGVGRLLERVGPRTVMTAAALIGTAATAGMALAPGLWGFAAAWLCAGAAMSGLFYPPAFAALTAWFGAARTTAVTVLTLVAGLSSTVFAPLTAALEAGLGWRGAYLVLAAILLVVVAPLHGFALTPPWPAASRHARSRGGPNIVRTIAQRRFLALTAALTLGAFGVYAVVVNQVPLLQARGFDTATAAWVLGVGGIGQVLGRLAYLPLEARTGARGRAVLVLAGCAATTGLLAAVPGPAAAVLLLGLLAGVARGAFTLLQATAVADRWGTERYATLNGILHTPLMLAIALAPWAGAALAGPLGGYPALFAALAAIGGLGAVAALATRPAPGRG